MKFQNIGVILNAIELAYKENKNTAVIGVQLKDLVELREYCMTMQESCLSLAEENEALRTQKEYAWEFYELSRKEKAQKVYLDSFKG